MGHVLDYAVHPSLAIKLESTLNEQLKVSGEWDEEKLEHCLPRDLRQKVLGIPFPPRGIKRTTLHRGTPPMGPFILNQCILV